jgi:hypothetical protein
MTDESLWYPTLEDYDATCLRKRTKTRNRTLESRTIILPRRYSVELAQHASLFVPDRDRAAVHYALVRRSGGAGEPYFRASRASGYHLLTYLELDSVASFSSMLFLPYIGTFGSPTAIINASKGFGERFGFDGHCFALMHDTKYIDINEEAASIPLGRIDA